ncbi:MAG: SDR family oxidoreductase [Fluviicola sp.]|nr:SDR family oxidoreductase [Fluviicola sp.]
MAHYLLIGASGGIAQATAAILKEQGHSITTLSRSEALTDSADHHTVESYNQEHLPQLEMAIDGLVYFPGTINLKPFHRLKHEEFLRDYEINAFGAVSVVQQYLPNLKRGDSASVVFISSVAARVGMPFHASVSMAKAALEGLTIALAAEYAPVIRFNAVAPSLTQTNLSEKLTNSPEKMENAMKRNPLKKVGSPEEVASAICFLLTKQSSWITGQVIAVDGGMRNIKLL